MDVLDKLDFFYKRFAGEKGCIGKTLLGEEIKYFCVEKTKSPTIIVQYAIHAREYITTLLALKQIKYFTRFGRLGRVYFIPAVNVDGIKISLKAMPLYKANARGVDLNVNFDANWGTGRSNLKHAGSENYIGTKPFSEPETMALRNFTLLVKPDITLSYHCKGEEIYYQFFQTGKELKRDLLLAKSLAGVTGYKIKNTPFSAGGYKDWCIQKLKIPSFTIEVGNDALVHPLKEKALKEIYKKNKKVITTLMESQYAKEIYAKSLKAGT